MKLTRALFLTLALIMGINSLYAQREETVVGKHGFGFSGIWGGSKNQVSQFGGSNQTSYLNGGFFGFEFGKALLVGWSHYNLMNEFNWDYVDNQEFDMDWNSMMLNYGFSNFKAIHPQIGVDFGGGRIRAGNVVDHVYVIQPSAGLEINVFRWFHIGLDGGYRFVNNSNIPGLTDNRLSGWFGQGTLKFGYSWGRYHKKAAKNASTGYEG